MWGVIQVILNSPLSPLSFMGCFVGSSEIPPSLVSCPCHLLGLLTKYWSFSFSIIPSKEIPGRISFRMYWVDLLAVQGTLIGLSYRCFYPFFTSIVFSLSFLKISLIFNWKMIALKCCIGFCYTKTCQTSPGLALPPCVC